MTTKTKSGTLDLAAECLENIRKARLSAADSAAAQRAAEDEAAAALRAREEAAEARVRGDKDAEEKWRGAIERLKAAAEQRATADEAAAAAARVVRNATARLSQLRTTDLEPFRVEAETQVSECIKAAKALEGPLQDYLNAWTNSAAHWRPLNLAVRDLIEEQDRELGRSRDSGTIAYESQVPACPLNAGVLDAVRDTIPRPRALNPDFHSGGVVPEVIFDGAGE